MDGTRFAQVRHYLEKTQAEMAVLLGVSAKAVQSFEQGWRKVPAHTERQLLFLVYLKRLPAETSAPCWDKRACEPETRQSCMAWELRAGNFCWFVNGTACKGRVQENWREKMRLCQRCEVFQSLVPIPREVDAETD